MSATKISPQTLPIGPRIRTLRHDRSVTLAELAQATGLSEATLSRIETGRSDISAHNLCQVAAKLEIDVTSFFGAGSSTLVPNIRSIARRDTIVGAEICIPSGDVQKELPFFTGKLGFRLEEIFPADNPSSVLLSGHGLKLRLERNTSGAPATLRLLCSDPDILADGKRQMVSPGGTKIEIADANPPMIIPQTRHSFMVRRLRDKAPWVIGRAGMQYRDLIPDRLGGSIIASHIRIPDGGPVPDMVHYHTIGFQLIYCYKGWVDVVYEDQGPKIRLRAGDCFIQPPQIRHRVLFASDNIEVIEIGVPAEHITTIDHNMTLPTGEHKPDRIFGGQKFVHHKVAEAVWNPWRIDGFEHRDTGICKATQGVANVQVARAVQGAGTGGPTSHGSDILFTFVMEGQMTLASKGQSHDLSAGDAFVIPPDQHTQYLDCSDDLELLEVSLPGRFDTARHESL